MEMDSRIQNFFRNKVVFLTGGTGFLGKVVIEKLLRSTDVKRIYVLTRAKAGKDISERFDQIFKEPLFDKLHTIREDPLQYIKPIAGDCKLPKLGISEDDRKELIENVDVVIHSAATVSFNEPLSTATKINVEATFDLIQMAKEMKNLKSFVHVSSAYANCLVSHLEERYYNDYLGITSEKLLTFKEILGNDRLDHMQADLVGKFPNTYTFTKSIAEEAVLSHGNTLPICIFRPGTILPTCAEPMPGWIDNLYGPLAVVYGYSYGVLRVIYGKDSSTALLVPVDYCANMILASAWYTAITVEQIPSTNPPIYNLVPDEAKLLSWLTFRNHICFHTSQAPLARMKWYPFLMYINNKFAYRLLSLIYHTLPGYLMDCLQLLMGKRSRMTKMYAKIHSSLSYFMELEITFDDTNVKNLWKIMTPADRKEFNFDMASLDYNTYFHTNMLGIRRFLAKEDPATIPQAKQLFKKLYVLNCAVHGLVFAGIAWLLWILWKFLTQL